MSPAMRGVLVLLFDCREGADEAWYDEVHIPDVDSRRGRHRRVPSRHQAAERGAQAGRAEVHGDFRDRPYCPPRKRGTSWWKPWRCAARRGGFQPTR
jgi:hypothetical protein